MRRRLIATPGEKRLRAAVGNLGVYAVCLGSCRRQGRRRRTALMRAPFRR